MARKARLKDLNNLKSSDLEDIFIHVKSSADTTSELVYVYSFTSKNVSKSQGSRAKSNFRRPAIRRRRSGELSQSRNRIISENLRKSPSSFNPFKEHWAVRLESSVKPINKVFSTKEEAKTYAKQLVSAGKGKKFVVIH